MVKCINDAVDDELGNRQAYVPEVSGMPRVENRESDKRAFQRSTDLELLLGCLDENRCSIC